MKPPAPAPGIAVEGQDLLLMPMNKTTSKPPVMINISASTGSNDTIPPNGTSPFVYASTTTGSHVTIMVLSAVLAFLSTLIIIIAYKLVRQTQQQQLQQQQQSPHTNSSSEPALDDQAERILRRYETIEHWLITKKVQVYDAFSQRVVQCIIPQSPPPPQQQQSNKPCGDNECPICMNEIKHNDAVSWSANPSCNHVFHHVCLKEWLLRRTACPYCRETVLPCDTLSRTSPHHADQLAALSMQYASRSSTMYYCYSQGLIELPSMVRCTVTELSQLKERIFGSILTPTMLSGMRDGPVDETSVKLEVEDASENPLASDDLMLIEYTSNGQARVLLGNADESSVREDEEAELCLVVPTHELETLMEEGLVASSSGEEEDDEVQEGEEQADEEEELTTPTTNVAEEGIDSQA